jgi:hypothetical protein
MSIMANACKARRSLCKRSYLQLYARHNPAPGTCLAEEMRRRPTAVVTGVGCSAQDGCDVRHGSADNGRKEILMSLRQSLQAWRTARQAQQLTCCRCLPLGCLLLLMGMVGMGLWEASQAEHTPALRWMQGYRNAEGVGCCSEQDCVPWPVALLQMTRDEATVRIGDAVIHLPSKSVHATQDGQSYWCCQTDAQGHCPPEPSRATTRCVFYAVGM